MKTEASFIKVLDAVDKMKEYSVTQIQQERFKDGLGPKIKMKFKFSDSRLYLYMAEGPKKNAEILYKPGWNNGKAKVHKGSFPDFNLNLDPHGSRMLDNQHHPIEHLSLERIMKTVYSGAQKCSQFTDFSDRVLKHDAVASIPVNELQIELIAPWKEKKETVQKDEDIWTFSRRVKEDPYLILYSNAMEYGDDLDEGASLKVPLCYATRTLLNVDANSYLPKKLESYDEQGKLYESYEWQDLNSNPGLKDVDFDPDNEDYGF